MGVCFGELLFSDPFVLVPCCFGAGCPLGGCGLPVWGCGADSRCLPGFGWWQCCLFSVDQCLVHLFLFFWFSWAVWLLGIGLAVQHRPFLLCCCFCAQWPFHFLWGVGFIIKFCGLKKNLSLVKSLWNMMKTWNQHEIVRFHTILTILALSRLCLSFVTRLFYVLRYETLSRLCLWFETSSLLWLRFETWLFYCSLRF